MLTETRHLPETPVLEVDRVTVQYGEQIVLDAVSFSVARGEFFGLIGPNGCGKTTLLRVILGVRAPTSGQVRLFGTPLESFRDWRRIGYVPQKMAVDRALPITVAEVVATGLIPVLRVGARLGAEHRRQVAESLALVGIEKLADVRIGALSMGQQQRVFIARALVSRPELLVLDEPTASIDVEAQTSFYQLLRLLNRDGAVTLILVSHDIGVVSEEVTRVACLNRHLLFCGRPADVLTADALSALYGSRVQLVSHRDPCAHAP